MLSKLNIDTCFLSDITRLKKIYKYFSTLILHFEKSVLYSKQCKKIINRNEKTEYVVIPNLLVSLDLIYFISGCTYNGSS